MTPDELRRRYVWQCRRGSHEVEILLADYLEHCFLTDCAEDQQRFGRLLACEDADLLAWFTGNGSPEDEELDVFVKTMLGRLADRRTATGL